MKEGISPFGAGSFFVLFGLYQEDNKLYNDENMKTEMGDDFGFTQQPGKSDHMGTKISMSAFHSISLFTWGGRPAIKRNSYIYTGSDFYPGSDSCSFPS
ncbi:MAG TPA: hypothetical protein VFT51_05205 [Bacillales bacterium]|nr:hypothetical protein [Bacillales bacterium]